VSNGAEEAFSTSACYTAIPFYDCLYLAVAKSLGAPMITADSRLLAKAALAPDITLVDLATVPPATDDET
jgi:predicted nucleic acid-binding protein